MRTQSEHWDTLEQGRRGNHYDELQAEQPRNTVIVIDLADYTLSELVEVDNRLLGCSIESLAGELRDAVYNELSYRGEQ